MKVQELIEQLQTLPKEYADAEIVIPNWDARAEYQLANYVALLSVSRLDSSEVLVKQGGDLRAVLIRFQRDDYPATLG